MGAAESTTTASSESSTAAGAAIALAAVFVVAWGISRMISGKDDEKKMEGTLMEARSYGLPNPGPPREYGVATWTTSGRFKMNTDGSCRPYRRPRGSVKTGPSGYGGVLTDHRGEFVQAFHGFIGVSDCLTAEIHGIYHGLLLLDELGLKEAILESDSSAAIELIEPENNSNRCRRSIVKNCWKMITDCRQLVAKNRIDVVHCPRGYNKLADKLADMGIKKQDRHKKIMDIPAALKPMI